MPNEVDTCRRYVVPKRQAAGRENEPHRINGQVSFTNGRVIVTGRRGRRRPGKRADYILRYRANFAIAVIEAKASYRNLGDALQQTKESLGQFEIAKGRVEVKHVMPNMCKAETDLRLETRYRDNLSVGFYLYRQAVRMP